ncbi:MAG: TDP-N-acetylfucosamine:lipid II N-acetylfucosaminyltransferase [Synergistaceae bacterium]|nr:TDP-N-acetylfucosamine:lipid II N-acetylfucosaminyltransferase [Synergistaceae bacterium]
MSIIVHFIHRDKFTAGYIEFMKLCFPEYEHHFFTGASDSPLTLYNSDNVHDYRRGREILLSPSYIRLLYRSSKVIISGVYISYRLKAFMLVLGSPLQKIDFRPIRAKPRVSDVIRIVAGNSAFPENQHIETFHLLAHLRDENIEVVCPLSYGSLEYREKVIAEGRKIFGGKFIPVTEFMAYEEYISFLAACDIGVFSNNRQQGMGNISLLLRLGKKVYMRDDTAMWQHYTKTRGFTAYPVSELNGITLEQLAYFPRELAYNNIQIADEYAAGNYAVQQWRKVFDD